jgi:hypothetical protein
VPIDFEKAQKEAQELYQAGEKKWGTDERFGFHCDFCFIFLIGC